MRPSGCARKAAKLFQKELHGTGRGVFDKDPLANFYYAIALRYDKSAAFEKKSNTILNKREIEGIAGVPMRLILRSRSVDKVTTQFSEPLAETGSVNLNNILAAFAMKHFHTMEAEAEADVDEYIRRVSKEGFKLLEVDLWESFFQV